MSTFHQSHLIRKSTGKRPRPRLSPERRHTFCASLRSRNACPHATRNIRRATLYGNLQEKCRGPDWAQKADTHFVRACAVETHVKISQEPLDTEIYRKNAAPQSEHPDQAPAFYSYRKNPSVWTHCLGKKICCLLGLKVENVWSDEMSERPDWNNPAISRKSPSWIKPFSNPPALSARVNRKQLRTLQALTWGSGVHFSLESCWFFMVLKRS